MKSTWHKITVDSVNLMTDFHLMSVRNNREKILNCLCVVSGFLIRDASLH